MVTFATLILWLITGPLPVEVAVAGDAAEVEVLLDGEPVGVDRAPPWTVDVDFGPVLRPHVLVAVARDADGRELGRARQLVNLPRPAAEVDVLLERDADGAPTSAVVITENVASEEAYTLHATLDGRLVPVDDRGRIIFGALDPERPHVLSIEAEFVDGSVARHDLGFGGSWGSEVRTELTAVAVTTDRRRPPSVDDIAASLRSDGEPVRVVAVEQPGHRLFAVRDQGAWPALVRHGVRVDNRLPRPARRRPVAMSELVPEDPDDDAVHLLTPFPEVSGSSRRLVELFPTSNALITTPVRRLDWLLTHLAANPSGGVQRLADAVAVAGVRAAGSSAPRAVLVVLTGRPQDDSAADPAAVRRFVADLNVPLYVWAIDGEVGPAWGAAIDVSRFSDLRAAVRDLERELDRQWLVWLEGEHLPHRLTMTPDADLALAR
jgi:hypothetical protein